MKPLYIKMQAFGSYQQAEIDFTQVQSGLFLITGDTGAGKTTIFDAITFALFDETSGGKRSGEMMRSQYAKQDLITEVEFRFSYYDNVYTVIRRPKQDKFRARTDDDGNLYYEKNKTPLGPDVELIMPDGTSFAGKKTETDKKIREIIGLDASQFTQIAMLAQGDFMKLLQASSKERMEIFSKIFDTRIYQLMELELMNRTKASNADLKHNEEQIHGELQRLQMMEGSAYREVFEEQSQFRASAKAEDVTGFVLQLIREEEEQHRQLNQQIETMDTRQQQLVEAKKMAERFNGIWEKYQSFLQKKAELDNQQSRMQTLQEQVVLAKKAAVVKQIEQIYIDRRQQTDDCRRTITGLQEQLAVLEQQKQQQTPQVMQKKTQYEQEQPELSGKIARVKDTYTQYDAYEQALTQQQTSQKRCDNLQKKWEADEALLAQKQQKKQQLTQQKTELEQKQEHVEVLDALIREKNQLSGELHSLADDVKQLAIDRMEGKRLRQIANDATDVQEQQERLYNQLYQQFLDSQAAILAQSLEEGQPCPVCGSRHHEVVAHPAGELVESHTLKAAQTKLDKARDTAQKAQNAVTQAVSEYRTKQTNVTQKGQKYYDSAFQLDTVSAAMVQQKQKTVDDEIAQLKQRRTAAEQQQQALQNCTAELTALEDELTHWTAKQQEQYQELQAETVKLVGYRADIEHFKQQLQYDTRAKAEQAVNQWEQQLKTRKQQWEDAEADLQKVVNQLIEKRGSLQTQQQMLQDFTAKQEEAQQNYQQSLAQQGFVTAQAYQDAQMTEQALQNAETTLQQYQQQVQENKAQLQTLEDEVQHREKEDVQKYQSEIDELQIQLKAKRQMATEIFSQIRNNQEIHRNLGQLYGKRDTLLRENSILKNLDATANGKLSGKHLKFQTYIQRRYFQQIVDNANKRLHTMSGGQFILQCRDTDALGSQGFVGLDLDVYSIVNDQSRDVKTLSGGESFMAALSLALGMADMIQYGTSSVHIDTMFIDEGFGSLSEETRNQAIAILNQLSGGKRLVGIISHVTELKQQIDRKLIVTKTEKGSKAAWEIL